MAKEAEKVAPRNDLKPSPLYKGSRAAHLKGQDPRFKYEWKTTDREHPRSLWATGQMETHEHGTDVAGYVQVAGWQRCDKQTDPKVAQMDAREDNGKGIDSAIRRGKQILCRLPNEEYEKYAVADKAYQDLIEKQLYAPDRLGDSEVSMTAVLSRDPDADRTKMLRESGHPLPGM